MVRKKMSFRSSQIKNTAFLLDTQQRFGKTFLLPDNAERFRKKRGLAPRPKRFRV